MTVAVQALLALISYIAPSANVELITRIISALAALIPALIQESKDMVPIVKNIVEQLRGNGNVTPEQLDQLEAMSAQIDANFDEADAAAAAEEADAGDAAGGDTKSETETGTGS